MSDPQGAVSMVRTGAVAMAGSREIVWVTGPDAVSFLDGLVSQNIAAMTVGSTARSLLLSPQGKLRATLFVLRGDNRVGLVADAGIGEVVAGDLNRFRIRVDVAIDVATEPVWEVWGKTAVDAAGEVPEVGSWLEADDVVTFPMPFRHSAIGRVVVSGKAPECPVVAADDLLSMRIEIGEPVMGVDLTEKTIPQEGADVADSVDFAKGCYLGQELVARIDSRGHVNNHLTGLLLAGEAAPASGSVVAIGERAVGTVTSAAWSPRRDGVVALAMMRVDVAAGTSVTVAGTVGTVADLPMED